MQRSGSVNKKQYKYDQVSDYVMAMIENGTLKLGDRAPSLRKLSQILKVSISTINQAYVQLEDKGVLQAKPQSGFYINADIQCTIDTPKPIISGSCQPRNVRFSKLFEDISKISNNTRIAPFAAAKAPLELMPVKALIRETRNMISRYPAASLDYCYPPGDEKLRHQIALRYSDIGVNVAADEIIITNGATEALSLSLQAVAKRGDIIVVESPTLFSVLRLIEKLGMLALEVDTDPATGINFDSLEYALDTMDVTAMLVVPNFNNPLGSLMPEANKKRLVQLLQERNIPLIEDDVYGDLYFGDERPGIAKCYDNDNRVLSCSSFSKTISPGFRMGWVAGGKHHAQIMEWKQASSTASPSLQQLVLAEFLRSGQYDRHLMHLRKALKFQVEKGRLMIARAFPKGTLISDPQGGCMLWIKLPDGVNCLDLYSLALEHNIGTMPGIIFSATRKFRNYIRLNCGSPWIEENEQAIQTLGELVHSLVN